MRIHEAAGRLGITPRAIRFYEEKGLISPVKTSENGYRDYSESDVEELRWIVSFRELGVPVDALPGVLASTTDPSLLHERLDRVRSTLFEELNELKRQVRTFDSVVSGLGQGKTTTPSVIHDLASKHRDLRHSRRSWEDRWQFDEIAGRFDAAPLPHLPEGLVPSWLYDKALDWMAEWIDPEPGESGLDLGAGTGNLSMRLATKGTTVTGVEQSAEMLKLFRAKLPHQPAKQGNLLSLPFTGERFDFIASSFALHHLDSKQQLAAISEMERVLDVDGRICISGLMAAENQSSLPASLYPVPLPEVQEWLTQMGFSTAVKELEKPVFLLFATRSKR